MLAASTLIFRFQLDVLQVIAVHRIVIVTRLNKHSQCWNVLIFVIKLFMCMLKMLFGQQVIHNLCSLLVLGCLVYSVLNSLVDNYHDGHLMYLPFCGRSINNNQSSANMLIRYLKWHLLRVFKSYSLKKFRLQKAMSSNVFLILCGHYICCTSKGMQLSHSATITAQQVEKWAMHVFIKKSMCNNVQQL